MDTKGLAVLALYKVIRIKDKDRLWRDVERLAHKEGLLGTIFVTSQGINGTLSGNKDSLLRLFYLLNDKYDLLIEKYNWSYVKKAPFKRLKVKKRQKLLPLKGDFNLYKERGKHVEPEDWNELIQNKETLLIDVRNDYESEIGTFKDSLISNTVNFVEFPDYIESLGEDLKEKKIAMFCTGGIRCEIASSYLINNGFKEVNQLKGGVLNYLDKIDKEDQLWEGDCFVFDERVSVDHYLEEGSFVQCFGCRRPLSTEDTKSKEYVRGISCSYCHEESSESDKDRFAQRQRQIDLSEERGTKHMGVSQKKLKDV